MAEGHHSRAAIAAGLLVVYILWGSTYLAMRIVVGDGDLPPFLAAGIRFLVAGAVLYFLGRIRGHARPTLPEWRAAIIVGFFLLLTGNGLVMWAEQDVDSGFAALIIATVPLWMVLIDTLLHRANKLDVRTIVGILLGLAGVATLVWDPAILAEGAKFAGAMGLVVAALSWSFGSLFSRRAPHPKDPLLASGMQMLSGGTALLIVGVWAHETPTLIAHVGAVDAWLALLYLIVFGSIIAYSTYMWLLRVTTPAVVSTYAYVNPVVAVLLGAWILDEAVTTRTLVGSAMILLAVIIIVSLRKPAPPRPTTAEPVATPEAAPQT